MTVYTWTVNQMFTLNTPDPGFVVRAFWTFTGSDSGVSASLSGVSEFTQPGDPFTPYDQLTQDQVIGWVQASLGPQEIAGMETSINANIQSQLSPPPIPEPQPLPWS